MSERTLLVIVLIGFLSGSVFAEMQDRKKTVLIVVHHSATNVGSVEAFKRHHVETNGWSDVGYHFVITNGNGGPDGELCVGRPIEKIGAHAKGRNDFSVGICLVGTDKFTDKQRETLINTIVFLCIRYDLYPSPKTVEGHHERCPGDGCELGSIIKEAQKRMTQRN